MLYASGNTNTFKSNQTDSFQHIPYHYMQKPISILECILCNLQYEGES